MSYLHKLLFTAYYRSTRRGHIVDNVTRFEELYRSERIVIEREGNDRLATILSHAAKTVPFYRELLRGLEITAENATHILATLPIMTKDMIRSDRYRLISDAPSKWVSENTSGGSTGEPIRILQDREMGQESRTGELLFLRWAGHSPGKPHLLIWGVPAATFDGGVSVHERFFRVANNETYFNCYRINSELLDGWIERITEIRPIVIEAYVDALEEVSRRIIDTSRTVPSPSGIITSAGVLTVRARDVISRAFRCPILNRYGSREVGNVACSCSEADELHVHEAWCHLEIVDDAGKSCEAGQEGHILVTLFANRTMPLLRYRIEDRGIWSTGECRCGRNTKRLAAVCGRMSDYLIAADGGHINGTALTTLLYDVAGIRRFQYRQTNRDKVTLTIAPMEGMAQAELKRVLIDPLQRLKELLAGTDVELQFDHDILPSKSGKFRYIINDVSSAV